MDQDCGKGFLVRYLLNIVYVLLLVAISPWLAFQAATKGKYRQGWSQKLWGLVPRRTGDAPCVWLHAVSVGEVNLLAPLIAEMAKRRPDWQFVISTTTQTGFDLARRKHSDRTVFFCPLDFSWAVSAAMRRVRPQLLLLAELELWPNLIGAARRHGAAVAVVNGRLSENSFRGYRRLAPFVRGVMRQLDLVLAQNETYAQRFLALGARKESVAVTGSIKFDGATPDRNNPATLRLKAAAGIAGDDIVWLAGSTQEPEEEIAVAVFRRLAERHPRLRLVLVPRHPERFAGVAKMLDQSGLPWQRRTSLAEDSPAPPRDPGKTKPRILLVDTVGELGAWWGAAQLAFVGGSLGNRGGQNMIEPAAYGAAVCFGPNTRNFRDVVSALLEREAAVVVADESELQAFLERCLSEPEFARGLGERARRFVAEQQGATAVTVDWLLKLAAGDEGRGGSRRSPTRQPKRGKRAEVAGRSQQG